MGYLYFSTIFEVVTLASLRSLRKNEIGAEGAVGLGNGLQKNTTLTELM